MQTLEQYIPFARKYRPRKFAELYGQEVLIKVLQHAIVSFRLAQSYLLTGIRGVGKTTSARIIAKTINCTAPVITDINVEPCDQCKNCQSFNEHRHPDIIEIDAASKTSVDDIRDILESSEYRPLLGIYKVFIIDEVHMLSKSAFNALLKVLEEPPAHIVFIFATTEVQKIPLTIVSRCQRYDLRRLRFDEILILLGEIARNERINIELAALKIIAHQSEGSARDAVALLDQAFCYSKTLVTVITAKMINDMLGLVETDTVIAFFEHLISRNSQAAIAEVNKVYSSSNSLENFVESICNFIGYLNKSKLLVSYHNPVYESYSDRIYEILSKTKLSQLSILWQIYSNGMLEIKQAHDQLISTEMLVIKSIYAQTLPIIDEVEELIQMAPPRQCSNQ